MRQHLEGKPDSAAELQAGVGRLVGHSPWSVVAGPGTGSVFKLNLGGRVPLPVPVRNPTLTEEERTYRGEYRLFVECAWRIETEEGVLCTWTDPNEVGGQMLKGLHALVGQPVTRVELAAPFLDLLVEFGGRYRLRMFCDRQPCYHIATPGWEYGVVRPGRLLHRPAPIEE